MSDRSLEALRDLAPGFVLGTLTLDERVEFDRALRDPALAPMLEAELLALGSVVEQLGAAQPVRAPVSLRARMQARIAQERESQERESQPSPTDATASASVRRAANAVVPAPARPSRAIPIGLFIAFAASAAVAVGLEQQVVGLRRDLASQRAALDSTVQRLAQREATLRTLTDAGNDLLLVRLAPGTPSGPNLQLFWDVKRGRALIHASGLRPLPDDRTYQLWMIRDGKPVSVALFRPDPDGAQLLRDIEVTAGTAGISAFAVTEEPATGSPQPTMQPFLVGALAP